MLNIGIDARTIFTSERTGIANYTLQLITGLLANNMKVTLFTNTIHNNPFPLGGKNINIIYGKAKLRPIWEQIVLPWLLYKHPVDIYHATWNYGIPLLYKKKSILTVHDIIPLTYKKRYFSNSVIDKLFFLSYKISLRFSLKKASQVITDSQYSFKQIVSFFPEFSAKIKVLPLGIDLDWAANKNNSAIINLPKKYILYYGGFEKRKNVELLIEAFNKIKSRIPYYNLVIVGKKNEYYDKFLKKYNNDRGIIFTDYINKQKLNKYLHHTTLMVYPSEYEGFGLPVLEAMAVGCPVITNKFSSIHEITGDAAIYYSNIQELGNIIINSVSNKNLLKSCELNGIERAKQFTWTNYIKNILLIYKV